jgi:hypothetical protein
VFCPRPKLTVAPRILFAPPSFGSPNGERNGEPQGDVLFSCHVHLLTISFRKIRVIFPGYVPEEHCTTGSYWAELVPQILSIEVA